MIWQIWYGNHEPVSSDDSDWDSAPQDNVQFIIEFQPDGQTRIRQGDYYVLLEDGRTVAAFSDFDLKDYLRRFVPRIKLGLYLTNEEYEKVKKEAEKSWLNPMSSHASKRTGT